MRRTRTFLVRVLMDDGEPPVLHGQIHEPAGSDKWRVSFASGGELWVALEERIQAEAGDLTVSPLPEGENP